MKKLRNLLALSAVAAASSAQANLIAYEGFDYSSESPGRSSTGLNGGTGWDGAWQTANDGSDLELVNVGLSYTGLTTVGTSFGTANPADGDPTGAGRTGFEGARRDFATSGSDVDSGTLYFSGLFQSYFNVNSAFVIRLHSESANANGADLSFWVNGGSAGISNGWTTPAGAGLGTYSGDVCLSGPATPTMFVLKYDYGTDIAELFLNPTITGIENGSVATLDFTAARGGIGAVTYYNTADYGTFDELRVATTWGDAVGVPEPSSYSLIAGCLALAWVMVRRRG